MKKYNATILLIDDDADFLFFVVRSFRKNGVTSPIQQVCDGAEAISYMMGEGKYSDRTVYAYPTFIITDLKMPRGDGFAVLQHLKGNPEWAIIPTVVFSSSSDPDDIKKSYMLGASAYHVKPHSTDELREHLELLHNYWMKCETPAVDESGRQLRTNDTATIGNRIPQPDGSAKQIAAPLPANVPTHHAREEPKWKDRPETRDNSA